ncbi:hypothetical protein RJT34_11848 [Clitoria ternatea]|uniref:Uncharacterized protein n=1 Tax=Clitoria ternatea TaxID=43366 RepID=A0AAN9PKE5_CLITE
MKYSKLVKGKGKEEEEEEEEARKMIMVVIMTEMLGEYTAVLTRVTARFLPRHGMSFGGLRRNLRFGSTTSSSDSASFMVYF